MRVTRIIGLKTAIALCAPALVNSTLAILRNIWVPGQPSKAVRGNRLSEHSVRVRATAALCIVSVLHIASVRVCLCVPIYKKKVWIHFYMLS